MSSGRLGPAERRAGLERAARETFDVVVVGGGVTGAGCALDAAARGLTVVLLEARDLAGGTSSRSGKTFHGGLRYLEQGNVGLVRTALRERDLMVGRLCPHLARPEPFLVPLTRSWERGYLGAGVLLYDILGGARATVPRHRHLSRRAALAEMPDLRPDGLRGALQYHDVRVDDARHTLALARTAARHGAVVLPRVAVTGLRRDGAAISGVRARDDEGGAELEVRGRAVVNATGVWAEDLQAMAGEVQVAVRPAKGVHVLVPRERIASRTGLIARAGDSVVVIRPWWRHWIIGTTDTPWDGARDAPAADRADVDGLLAVVNRWLRRPLAHADVTGAYAGLRPLLSGRSGVATAQLSRDHTVIETAPGLITVVGGKYTTYRVMAAEAIDAAILGHAPAAAASISDRVPLLGADGLAAARASVDRAARETGLSRTAVEHLIDRHGALLGDVLDLVADRPELRRPLAGTPYLEAEVVHAATHEGALRLEDVLERRTHCAIETADHGLAAAPRAAALLAETLGWDDARREREVAAFEAAVSAILPCER